jgi:hypothetical protein
VICVDHMAPRPIPVVGNQTENSPEFPLPLREDKTMAGGGGQCPAALRGAQHLLHHRGLSYDTSADKTQWPESLAIELLIFIPRRWGSTKFYMCCVSTPTLRPKFLMTSSKMSCVIKVLVTGSSLLSLFRIRKSCDSVEGTESGITSTHE